jgi:hypothetical protein
LDDRDIIELCQRLPTVNQAIQYLIDHPGCSFWKSA